MAKKREKRWHGQKVVKYSMLKKGREMYRRPKRNVKIEKCSRPKKSSEM